MSLIDTIAWAVVELEAARPNVKAVKSVLEQALATAAKDALDQERIKANLIRIAQVAGVDGTLTGTTRIRP